ncbi:MAG: dTDP-4-dehydrorhamnose reductase [Nitriliruptorales bacterium]|nr:dTDP-4-dehydrorhamnose reductase [Nitriliruptorales bacterium]
MVTGAGGQLGQDLLDVFAEDEVHGFTHDELDVAEEPAVWAAVRDIRPDVVIHAAAWTDVDGCQEDPDRAHRVNALGSWWVARACAAADAAMVLVSTDYVFAGEGRGGEREPYSEFDPIDPLNVYGRSKAAAEQLVRQTLEAHYIVRTAWVNGARGSNFVRTMLRVGREQGAARVVDDQRGSPTFTRDLAAAIRELTVSGRYGTYHRTNSGECTWFELAAATYELAGVDVDLQPLSSDELDRPAPRPNYSVLSNRHAELVGLSPLPHWRDSLERMLAELDDADARRGDDG